MSRYVTQVQYGARADLVPSRLIAAMDDEQLAALLAARPDLADPRPYSVTTVQQRAGSWASVSACLVRLDVGALQVIQALSLLPSGTSVGELAALLGSEVTDADLRPVLDRLAALALLDRDDTLRLSEMAREDRYPGGLGPQLTELLGRLQVRDLQGIAERIGAERPSRKADLQRALHAELTRPGRVEQLLEDAPDPVLTLALALADGPPIVTYDYYGQDNTPVGWLKARGLVISPSYGQALMPREVALALRGGRIFPVLRLAPSALELRSVDPDLVASRAVESARRLVDGLVLLLEELEQRPAALLKSGGVGIREVRRAATVLGVGEAPAAQVLELAAAAGLIGRADGRLLVATGVEAWREQDTPSRWAALVAGWLALPQQLSVAGAPDYNGKPTPPMRDPAPDRHAQRVRRLLLDTVAEHADGTAAAVPGLASLLEWTVPAAWHGDATATDLIGELDLLGLAVDGALSPLGRALVAGGPPQARDALAGLLPPLSRSFVLQADLTAIASGELDPAVRRELESMADRESSGGAAVYRFSSASVRRAFDEGRDSVTLLAFLTGHAAQAVPQPLEYLIGDLGRRFGQLRLRGVGCYLRSDDTALLTELTRARALAPLGLSLIAPTVLAVEADATTAMAALRAQGYLPAAEGPDGQPLVVRRVAPRAPASGRGVGPLTVDQDWVGLVAQLRAGEPELSGPQLSLVPDDEPARPTLRSGDPDTMRGLLALAIEQEWAVGVTVRGAESTVLPWDVVDGDLLCESPDSAREYCLPLCDVTGVRILDAVEELHSLLGS